MISNAAVFNLLRLVNDVAMTKKVDWITMVPKWVAGPSGAGTGRCGRANDVVPSTSESVLSRFLSNVAPLELETKWTDPSGNRKETNAEENPYDVVVEAVAAN